ncbi:MAG: M16 family metallopeptidase [Sandaracinaceae bacterium]
MRLYGAEDPRVRRDRLLPNRVAALNPAVVRTPLMTLLAPHETALIVVGDIDASQVEAHVRSVLGELEPPPAAEASERAPAPSFPTPETRLVVHGTGAGPTAHIQLSERGPPLDHPDHPAFRVLARLAGGLFSSRLNLALREQRGDAYGVVSRVVDHDDHALLEISVAVQLSSAGDASAAIVEELARLSDPAQIGDNELSLARTVELADLRRMVDTPTGLGAALAMAFAARQSPEALGQTYSRVSELTPADIAATARRWVRPDKAPMVVVGHHLWLFTHPIRVPGGVGFVERIYD